MSDPLTVALKVAASGLDAQSTRMRVVSENMANAQSTGSTPAADPYRRKVVDFTSVLDQQSGASEVRIDRITTDRTDFSQVYDPGNPAADSRGMVKMPNVNMITEMADMREANRSYEANLQTIRQARNLISMTIDLLRN